MLKVLTRAKALVDSADKKNYEGRKLSEIEQAVLDYNEYARVLEKMYALTDERSTKDTNVAMLDEAEQEEARALAIQQGQQVAASALPTRVQKKGKSDSERYGRYSNDLQKIEDKASIKMGKVGIAAEYAPSGAVDAKSTFTDCLRNENKIQFFTYSSKLHDQIDKLRTLRDVKMAAKTSGNKDIEKAAAQGEDIFSFEGYTGFVSTNKINTELAAAEEKSKKDKGFFFKSDSEKKASHLKHVQAQQKLLSQMRAKEIGTILNADIVRSYLTFNPKDVDKMMAATNNDKSAKGGDIMEKLHSRAAKGAVLSNQNQKTSGFDWGNFWNALDVGKTLVEVLCGGFLDIKDNFEGLKDALEDAEDCYEKLDAFGIAGYAVKATSFLVDLANFIKDARELYNTYKEEGKDSEAYKDGAKELAIAGTKLGLSLTDILVGAASDIIKASGTIGDTISAGASVAMGTLSAVSGGIQMVSGTIDLVKGIIDTAGAYGAAGDARKEFNNLIAMTNGKSSVGSRVAKRAELQQRKAGAEGIVDSISAGVDVVNGGLGVTAGVLAATGVGAVVGAAFGVTAAILGAFTKGASFVAKQIIARYFKNAKVREDWMGVLGYSADEYAKINKDMGGKSKERFDDSVHRVTGLGSRQKYADALTVTDGIELFVGARAYPTLEGNSKAMVKGALTSLGVGENDFTSVNLPDILEKTGGEKDWRGALQKALTKNTEKIEEDDLNGDKSMRKALLRGDYDK